MTTGGVVDRENAGYEEDRETDHPTCNHNWEWVDDWMGDPNVINGTQDLSRWECSKCGTQANCGKKTDPNDAWGER